MLSIRRQTRPPSGIRLALVDSEVKVMEARLHADRNGYRDRDYGRSRRAAGDSTPIYSPVIEIYDYSQTLPEPHPNSLVGFLPLEADVPVA